MVVLLPWFYVDIRKFPIPGTWGQTLNNYLYRDKNGNVQHEVATCVFTDTVDLQRAVDYSLSKQNASLFKYSYVHGHEQVNGNVVSMVNSVDPWEPPARTHVETIRYLPGNPGELVFNTSEEFVAGYANLFKLKGKSIFTPYNSNIMVSGSFLGKKPLQSRLQKWLQISIVRTYT